MHTECGWFAVVCAVCDVYKVFICTLHNSLVCVYPMTITKIQHFILDSAMCLFWTISVFQFDYVATTSLHTPILIASVSLWLRCRRYSGVSLVVSCSFSTIAVDYLDYLVFYITFNSQGHIAMGSLQVEKTSAYCKPSSIGK